MFAAGGRTLGIGAGQMSRVDSVRIAVSKARAPLAGSVVASDAFFPFRDGVDEAAKAGATAVIQPGGSVRDAEVDRRRRRARPGDGVHRRAPLPALGAAGVRVFLVGSGGREHALAWKLGQSPLCEQIVAAPGNPGHRRRGEGHLHSGRRGRDQPSWSRRRSPSARISSCVGRRRRWPPGWATRCAPPGLPFFGPSRAAAEIEGSKAFAKQLMRDAGVPTAAFGVFDDVAAADAFIDAQPGAVVVKADGLAAGKGVVVTSTKAGGEGGRARDAGRAHVRRGGRAGSSSRSA